MKKLLLNALLCLFAGVFTAHAQHQIRGMVTDSASGKPLEFITVTLLKDQKAVKGNYTGADGVFTFRELGPAAYEVQVTAVGYRNCVLPVEITDRSVDLGKIAVRENAAGLREVKITAAKPIVQQEADRILYDIQADPESKVFNVLDMMRKVPYLSLDADDNILLKGNGGFKILLNGKPSGMLERNYKDILRSMPASSIQRIEVITTPPSKYDAEGLSGIINIITNKRVDNGYTGNLNTSWRFPAGGPGAGGSVSARLGKWGLSAFGGASRYDVPELSFVNTRSTFRELPTLTDQRGTNSSESDNAYLGLEVSYDIDSLNLISGQLNVNGNRNNGLETQTSRLETGSGLDQYYRLLNTGTGRGNGRDVALNYQRGFKADKNRLLTFSYRYYGFENNQQNTIGIDDRFQYELPDYRQLNDQRFSEQTLQTDFVYPSKTLSVEAGVKAIFRKNESNFGYLNRETDTGEYQQADSLSNHYLNAQTIFGLYNTYRYKYKGWNIRGGFRVEQTLLDADFISTHSKVRQNYFNVIPTVALGHKAGKGNLTLSYTQRIQRPGIYQLNPFVDRTNPNFERTGNPDLRPAIMNDMNIGYSWAKKTSVSVIVGYVFIKDMIFPVLVYNPATGISRSSYQNVGKARLFPTVFLNTSRPLSKEWNLSVNWRLAYGETEGLVNNEQVKNRGFMYAIYASTGYRLPKSWRINAGLDFNGPGMNIQDRTNSALFSSVSVSKEVVKDKLTFSGSLNNPFRKYRKSIRDSFGPDFVQYNERNNYFRSVSLSLNYKFGKLKEPIRKAARSIRNDDVQNEGR